MGLWGGLVQTLKKGLRKTREAFAGPFRSFLSIFAGLDAQTEARLEELLMGADFGVEATAKILSQLRQAHKRGEVRGGDQLLEFLKRDLKNRLTNRGNDLCWAPAPPTVLLVCGVNGVGKTTSIAKLAGWLAGQNKKVLLAAADTFRAAATDQLAIWADRLGADLVRHKMGADPAAVVYDAADAALARRADVLIIDTAGRLQTKENLMKELAKIRTVAARKIPGAPHEVLLVLDATTGQNALSQADHFKAATNVTGLFLAKLDGTAKGGIVVAIQDRFDIPVKFVGTGENPEDIAPFQAGEFVDALLE